MYDGIQDLNYGKKKSPLKKIFSSTFKDKKLELLRNILANDFDSSIPENNSQDA